MADESTDPRIHGAKGKLFFEEVSPVSPADNANVAPVPYLKAGTKHVLGPGLPDQFLTWNFLLSSFAMPLLLK